MQEAEAKAHELGRPLFVAMACDPCPFCVQEREQVYNTDEVGQVLCREFVCCWTESAKDAAEFDVSRFPWAAVVVGKEYRKFRPATNPAAFLEQLKAERAKL